MFLLSPPPSRSQRVLDVVLGVRRRRRQVAYLAIVGGVRALRPMLLRLAVLAAVVVVVARL